MVFSCGAHAGDAMWALMFLRKLGSHQNFFTHDYLVADFRELMADTDIYVGPLSEWDGSGFNCWVADAQFEGDGVVWQCQHDIMEFVMRYFNSMARRIIGIDLFFDRSDMLWDSASIGPAKTPELIDCLIVCADPLSGQCPEFSRSELYEQIVIPMTARYGKVIVANAADGQPSGYTFSQIGAMATVSKRIICLPNGPAWSTFNKWTTAERIVFLSPMHINYGVQQYHHVANVTQAAALAKQLGWL